MKILKPTFRAALQSDGTLELLVYEDIGVSYWRGGVTAKDIKQQIDAAGPFTGFRVRINSPGGDAFEGIAIANLLRSHGKPIETCVDGLAASAASIVAMAGDKRTMASNAMMMIHNAWSQCEGYASDMRKMADTLDSVSGVVAKTYADRAGLPIEDAQKLMDAESWLTSDECIKLGLATDLAEEDPDAMNLARGFKALARLPRLPQALRADAADGDPCLCACQACQDGRCEACDCQGCDALNCAHPSCNCAASVEDKADLSAFDAELALIELGPSA